MNIHLNSTQVVSRSSPKKGSKFIPRMTRDSDPHGPQTVILFKREYGELLLAVREFDTKFIKNDTPDASSVDALNVPSEQAHRASIRQAILSMKLKMAPANKSEIKFLKLQGALGKRAPSCSLLNSEDMTKLLECFGKMGMAARLRLAMRNPPVLESDAGFLTIPAMDLSELPADTVPAPTRRRKTVKHTDCWDLEVRTPPPLNSLVVLNDSYHPTGRNGKRSASPPRMAGSNKKQRALSYSPPEDFQPFQGYTPSCSCPDCGVGGTGYNPTMNYQGYPQTFTYQGVMYTAPTAASTYTAPHGMAYYPQPVYNSASHTNYIPMIGMAPQNLIQTAPFCPLSYVPPPAPETFLANQELHCQIVAKEESPRSVTPPPITTDFKDHNVDIANDSTLLGQLKLMTPVDTPGAVKMQSNVNRTPNSLSLSSLSPPPPLFKIDAIKIEAPSPYTASEFPHGPHTGTPIANLQECEQLSDWYFGQ